MDSQPQGQSSFVLGVRSLIMLVGMVAVPLAAIFGSSLPDLVKEFGAEPAEDHGEPVAWNTTPAAAPQKSAGSSPFGGAGAIQPPAGATMPTWQQGEQSLPPGMTPPAGAMPGQVAAQIPATAQAVPAAWNTPPVGGAPAQASYEAPLPVGAPQTPPTQLPPGMPEGIVPPPASYYQQPAAATPYPQSAPQQAAATPAVAPPAAAAGAYPADPRAQAPAGSIGPERFTLMERRLRELGATYYLLEAWGGDGAGLFRFHCKMAIAGNAQLNRHFEATDPDPLRAMEQVLGQVEMWRSGRQP